MLKDDIYFIALIPGSGLWGKINIARKDFATRFNRSRALKVYPHITLKVPSDNGCRLNRIAKMVFRFEDSTTILGLGCH